MRRLWLVVFALAQLLLLAPASRAQPSGDALTHTITVPLDYSRPSGGRARLTYEFGAAFDPSKPTLIVVADGQQYFVRQGAAAKLQQQLFGPNVNVVALITRGSTPAFVDAALGADGQADWLQAWRIFNAGQWIEDIERVRREVVGDRQVMLYGRSGGSYLVHQYLTRYGVHVSRAFTQSPVNPRIARELNIDLDRFWETLGREQPELQPVLLDALKRRPDQRAAMLMTLQRQHFYVPADKLLAERARLIQAFSSGDDAVYAELRRAYEVDGVTELMRSKAAIPQIVRVVELIGPSGAFDGPRSGLSPLIEPQQGFAKPLLDLQRAGRIPAPAFDLDALHRIGTEVFILAGRDDEAVDYRTSIALAYSYPRHLLFIAGGDNHNFSHLDASGETARLVQAFFESGATSPRMAQALAAAGPDRWIE
jgi:pimeloyl-ACP methyl ester carboxylesterase